MIQDHIAKVPYKVTVYNTLRQPILRPQATPSFSMLHAEKVGGASHMYEISRE